MKTKIRIRRTLSKQLWMVIRPIAPGIWEIAADNIPDEETAKKIEEALQ